MNEILKIIPLVIYFFIGAVSAVMALKLLLSGTFLPFHEAAYGKPWEGIEKHLQIVIITLMKISGFGFLTIAFLLIIFPIYNYYQPNLFLKYSIPLIAFIFCSGLFIVNFNLFKKTKAQTPWKNSLIVMILIVMSIIISSI
jgi:hypothetical protein